MAERRTLYVIEATECAVRPRWRIVRGALFFSRQRAFDSLAYERALDVSGACRIVAFERAQRARRAKGTR